MTTLQVNLVDWDQHQNKLDTLSGAWLAVDHSRTVWCANPAARSWINGGLNSSERNRLRIFVRQLSRNLGDYGLLPLSSTSLTGLSYPCLWAEQATLVNLKQLLSGKGENQNGNHVGSKVSQALRDPVTKIELFTNLFLQGRTDRKEFYRDTLLQETERLTRFIENLNLMEQLDSSTPYSIEPIQVEQLSLAIEDSLKTVPTKESCPHQVIFEAQGQLVRANTRLICLSIRNLLSSVPNVESVEGHTTIRIQHHFGWIQISLLDPWFRVIPEDLNSLFAPLDSGQIDLELVLVRDILLQHQGFLTARLDDGRFRFSLWLPVWKQTGANLAKEGDS